MSKPHSKDMMKTVIEVKECVYEGEDGRDVAMELRGMELMAKVEHQFFALLPGAGNCEAVCSSIYAQFALSLEA